MCASSTPSIVSALAGSMAVRVLDGVGPLPGPVHGSLLVTDFWDNVCAGARGLRRDKGAPPAGGSEAAYH
jgi:hypothetical protein